MKFENFEKRLKKHDEENCMIKSTDFCFSYLLSLGQERMGRSEFETFEMAIKVAMRLMKDE
jgi:hypothetical protein